MCLQSYHRYAVNDEEVLQTDWDTTHVLQAVDNLSTQNFQAGVQLAFTYPSSILTYSFTMNTLSSSLLVYLLSQHTLAYSHCSHLGITPDYTVFRTIPYFTQ